MMVGISICLFSVVLMLYLIHREIMKIRKILEDKKEE